MDDSELPFEVEYINQIGELETEITQLKEKLQTTNNLNEVYKLLKQKNGQVKILVEKLTGRRRILYEEKRKRTYFEELFYSEKYFDTLLDGESLDLNIYLDIAEKTYQYFYREGLEIPSYYKEFLYELLDCDEFQVGLNFIIKNLKRVIEDYECVDLREENLFRNYNILGDLYFTIYLLIEEQAKHATESIEEYLDTAIECYSNALSNIKYKGSYFKDIKYLTIFISYFKNYDVVNLYDYSKKYDVLQNNFEEKFKSKSNNLQK